MDILIDIANNFIDKIGMYNVFFLGAFLLSTFSAISEDKNKRRRGFVLMLLNMMLAIVFK